MFCKQFTPPPSGCQPQSEHLVVFLFFPGQAGQFTGSFTNGPVRQDIPPAFRQFCGAAGVESRRFCDSCAFFGLSVDRTANLFSVKNKFLKEICCNCTKKNVQ
jgi:hypothetical protein